MFCLNILPFPRMFPIAYYDNTWSECYVIESDTERGFCYPSMFFAKDDAVLVVYCRGGGEDGFCLNHLGMRKMSLKEI